MIEIFVQENNPVAGFIWNAEDVFKLRRDHRIIGSFVGCLPRAPRQDNFLGIPLILSPEEIDLAVNEGFAKTVTVPVLNSKPSPDVKATFDRYRQTCYEGQIEVFRDQRKREIVRMSDQIIEGKRRKILSENPDSSESEVEAQFSEVKDEILQREFQKIRDIKPDQMIVQTFNGHPWIRESDKVPFVWKPASQEPDRIRRSTFRTLWLRGFFITAGDKFGGDFLIYQGDPVLFHAQFIVICSSESELSTLETRDLVCRSRLGSGVNKTVLIACADGNDVVTFKALKRLNVKKKK